MKVINNHDLHQFPTTPADVQLGKDEQMDLLVECHYVLTRSLDIRQPQWLQNEVTSLIMRVEQGLNFYKIQ